MTIDKDTYKLSNPGKAGKMFLVAGAAGAVLSLVGYFSDPEQFFHSYLASFVYWVTFGLGGLFFTMLHHLVNGKWSVVLRRISESFMMTLPYMAVFVIPIILGMNELYHWSVPEVVAEDHLIQKKTGYLNDTFFIIRIIMYFMVWIIFSFLLYRVSLKEDAGYTDNILKSQRKISAIGMILFAFSITYFSFDLMMSLDAHWYSTIYGAYFFGGILLGFLAFISLFSLLLQKNNILSGVISIEHYHDLSRLIFAFVVFWAYIAFSQYFLIWYGNIPEETLWYLHRWEGSWKVFGYIIIFGHFIVPFILLMTRASKRNPVMIKFICIWLLVMHYIDIYWLVLPSLHEHGAHVSWIDFTTFIALGGFFLFFLWRKFSANPLVPVGDPKLDASINFTN